MRLGLMIDGYDRKWNIKKGPGIGAFRLVFLESFGETLEGFGVILGECREDFAVDDIAGLLESADELRV